MSEEDIEAAEDVAIHGAKKAAGELIVTTLTPAAEELGKGLTVIAKTVNACLSPLSAVVWGYEEIRSYIETSVSNRLKGVSPEKIVTPSAHIAGPTIEAMRFVGGEPELREMFSSLLATAMNSDLKQNAHPAYVEVVKQISVDEALILSSLRISKYYPMIVEVTYEGNDVHIGYENLIPEFQDYCSSVKINHQKMAASYLDNLQRLRLLEVRQKPWGELENKDSSYHTRHYDQSPEYTMREYGHDAIYVTEFGQQFLNACLPEESNKLTSQ